MRGIAQMCTDIRDRLIIGGFSTVRISTATMSPQLLNELKAISSSKLPAVVIVIGDGSFDETVRKRALSITLVLIDRFVAGSDEKAVSVFTALEALQALFPPDTIEIEGVHYRPRNFYAASGDPAYVCFALALEAIEKTF